MAKKPKKTGIPAQSPTQKATAKRGNINQFPQGADQAPNKQAWQGEVERRRSFENQSKPQITALNGKPINNEQFNQFSEAKKTGVAPQDMNAAMLFKENQESLADQRLRKEVTDKDIEDKKKLAIKAELNPVAPIPSLGLSSDLPNIPTDIKYNPYAPTPEDTQMSSLINGLAAAPANLKEVYLNTLNPKMLSKLASRKGWVSAALALFTAKDSYISNKAYDQQDELNLVVSGIEEWKGYAESGTKSSDEVRAAWANYMNRLGKVESNVQRLTKMDDSYFQTGQGAEIQERILNLKDYLNQSKYELDIAIEKGKLMPKPVIQ